MSGTINISTIEELYQFLNEKGIMEIAIRGKNKRFKAFQKITLRELKQSESLNKAEQAIALLNKNNQIGMQSIKMLSNITKLSKLTMVLSGLNLFVTAAGFALMNAQLNKINSKLDEVIALYKDAEDIHATYEVNKVIADHSDMLDGRKRQNYYSEAQMRKLVADEYNILDMLINIFMKDLTNNQEVLVFTILSMASMLAASLCYFDEAYYFSNEGAIEDDDIWHLDHDKWTSLFDRMMGEEFLKKIQDYGFLGLGLSTVENDYFYKSVREQIRGLKQEIEDNQRMITTLGDPELFVAVRAKMSEAVKEEIKDALIEADADPKEFEKMIRAAVA